MVADLMSFEAARILAGWREVKNDEYLQRAELSSTCISS